MIDAMGEYAEAGAPGGHPHHPSMSSAMNSTLSRIDQLMRDQERQYMTLPPFQNSAANNVKVVSQSDFGETAGASSGEFVSVSGDPYRLYLYLSSGVLARVWAGFITLPLLVQVPSQAQRLGQLPGTGHDPWWLLAVRIGGQVRRSLHPVPTPAALAYPSNQAPSYFVGGSGSSTYDYAGSTEPLPTSAAIRKKQDSFTGEFTLRARGNAKQRPRFVALVGQESHEPENPNQLFMRVGPLVCSALFTVFSLLAYSVDLASDAVICYLFYVNRNLLCAGITFAFTVTPSVIVNVFSVRWYVQDDKESSKAMKDTAGLEDTPMLHRPKMSLCDWLVRIIFHLLLLGPVIRPPPSSYRSSGSPADEVERTTRGIPAGPLPTGAPPPFCDASPHARKSTAELHYDELRQYLELLVYGVKSRRQARQRGEQWPYAAANRIEQPKERQVSVDVLTLAQAKTMVGVVF
ncbi:XK-related protein 6-like [Tropilaelaps mercedesae]|uniref:XK-related protein n=1 Tax=Tropilaelaps mercedesae TaxID=418985 RepID=A0A1V9WZK3_9ACAR|nr:XK-related protein 6-like [Tropilaelaps mercedesae]